MEMKRADKKTGPRQLRASERNPRIVPLMVPHGCAAAGRDFESAFDVLQSGSQVHVLWRRPARTRLARAS
jgi:hypothetical protein